MPATDIIQSRGIFDFGQGRVVIAPVLQQYEAIKMEADRQRFVGEYVLLCAAEFASVAAFAASAAYIEGDGGPRSPLMVGPEATWQALVKCDCVPYEDPCPWASSGGGLPEPWWDILLFAGDMHKVRSEFAGGENVSGMVDLVRRLERRHEASQVTAGSLVVRSGLLRVQGLLWQARLSLLADGQETAERAVSDYIDEVPLWGQGTLAGGEVLA